MSSFVRVRLRFVNGGLLSKWQKREGLKRCWVLFSPEEFETVSKLTFHLVDKFLLHESCPNGLILSMDGYVLPPFESTCIFQDKDIIWVRRKLESSKAVFQIDESSDEDTEIAEKQPLLPATEPLAMEDHKISSEEDVSSQDEEHLQHENGAITKKRKYTHSEESKSKKLKSIRPEKDLVTSIAGDEEAGTTQEERDFPQQTSQRRPCSNSLFNVDDGSKIDVTPEIVKTVQHRVDVQQATHIQCLPGGNIKVPSRSSRRKKAKRRWRREQAECLKKQLIENNMSKKMTREESVQLQSCGEGHEDEVVARIVRPGHIRFETLDEIENDQATQNPTKRDEGITIDCLAGFGQSSAQKEGGNEVDFLCGSINFEKLASIPCSPKQGDVIAYRVVELSSSLCPDLSSFRVGKVSSYNSTSRSIVLVPVPECPLSVSENVEGGVVSSLYNEDGSLEIDFSLLVDVRVVDYGVSYPMLDNTNHTPETSKEKGLFDAFDEVHKALEEKKAQLLQEGDHTTVKGSSRTPWSKKALRGGALGPTIALLRAQNIL